MEIRISNILKVQLNHCNVLNLVFMTGTHPHGIRKLVFWRY